MDGCVHASWRTVCMKIPFEFLLCLIEIEAEAASIFISYWKIE